MQLPCVDAPFRIIGIDPGIDTMGISLLELHIDTKSVMIRSANTYRGSHMEKDYALVSQYQSSRLARLMAHEENLVKIFHEQRPHAIACEGPYMARYPQAYAALTECVTTIRRAVNRYDSFLSLLVYDPSNIKKSVGAHATSGNKDDMLKNILSMVNKVDHPLKSYVDINSLDDHSVDSIAIAWLCSQHILSDINGEGLCVVK